jgi:hypothetical protein
VKQIRCGKESAVSSQLSLYKYGSRGRSSAEKLGRERESRIFSYFKCFSVNCFYICKRIWLRCLKRQPTLRLNKDCHGRDEDLSSLNQPKVRTLSLSLSLSLSGAMILFSIFVFLFTWL